MTQATTAPGDVDPFATAAPAGVGTGVEDEFEGASDSFLKAKHLENHVVLIRPKSAGTRISKLGANAGKPYTYVECDLVNLEGPANAEVGLGGPGAMHPLVQLVGDSLTPQLKGAIGRTIVGKMISYKSQYGTPGYKLAEITDHDRQLARAYLAEEKRRAAAQAATDPFAGA